MSSCRALLLASLNSSDALFIPRRQYSEAIDCRDASLGVNPQDFIEDKTIMVPNTLSLARREEINPVHRLSTADAGVSRLRLCRSIPNLSRNAPPLASSVRWRALSSNVSPSPSSDETKALDRDTKEVISGIAPAWIIRLNAWVAVDMLVASAAISRSKLRMLFLSFCDREAMSDVFRMPRATSGKSRHAWMALRKVTAS